MTLRSKAYIKPPLPCIGRGLSVFTIADNDDIYGHAVAYERLLLITHVTVSVKTISEDGGFEIRNLIAETTPCRAQSYAR
jgi:hypothetical protein